MKGVAVGVIVAGICAAAAGLALIVGPAGLIAGGVFLAAFGAVGIEVDDE